MKKSEKQILLLKERLNQVERLGISDAAELLGLTESSVRRIFSRMEHDGLAIRVLGGLARIPSDSGSYNYKIVETVALPEKRRIAAETAKRILEYNDVYLDSGSTLYRVSLALANIIERQKQPSLRIFTNSLKNLEVLQSLVPIRLSGGDYRPLRNDFYGSLAKYSLSILNFDLCVIGADGIDFDSGISATDFDTAEICSAAIKKSKHRILVADSSKFNKSALVTFADLSEINTIITDSNLDSETAEKLQKYNLELVTV